MRGGDRRYHDILMKREDVKEDKTQWIEIHKQKKYRERQKTKKQLGNQSCCTENTDKKKGPRDHVCNFVKDFIKSLKYTDSIRV